LIWDINGDLNKPLYKKDPYTTSRIQWKVRGFFCGSIESDTYPLLKIPHISLKLIVGK